MSKVNELISGPYEWPIGTMGVMDTRTSKWVAACTSPADAQRVCDALNLYTNFMSNAEHVLAFTTPPRNPAEPA